MAYDVWQDIWPERDKGHPLAPVRVGVDRRTGRILVGWPHVVQSLQTLFATRYHERILRPWVGSFVPHLLGENAVESVIARFFWAIATAIDLWEPCYKLQNVRLLRRDGSLPIPDQEVGIMTSVDELRRGEITFQMHGIYMPRGHLGDPTPENRRQIGIIGRGSGRWDVLPGTL